MFRMHFLFNRLNMIENKFYSKMRSILKDEEFDLFCNSLDKKPKRGLVFNNLVMAKEDFLSNFKYSIEQLDCDSNCFILNDDVKIGADVFHHSGAIYMQEPSAMIPGLYLPLKNGDLVLDACASPGGKTFQIAKRLNGILLSNEIDFERAKVLNGNVERLSLSNVIVSNFTAEELAKNYPNKFDCVLVDAPCSGEGMFRKEDKAITQWSEEYVQVCAERQKQILLQYDKTLKEGGYLMYSTCTYSPEENEQIVSFLVDNGYKIVNIGNIAGSSEGLRIDGYNTELCKRFYPHKSFGEGQFVCLLQKEKTNDLPQVSIRTSRFKVGTTVIKLLTQFFKENLTLEALDKVKDNLFVKGDNIFYVKDLSLIIDQHKIVNYGVLLGSVVKSRFEPHHNLFKCFSDLFIRKVDVDEKTAYEYLKGNTFDYDIENGWCVVRYKNSCLGGGKTVDKMVKNHYPKGLRLINTKK